MTDESQNDESAKYIERERQYWQIFSESKIDADDSLTALLYEINIKFLRDTEDEAEDKLQMKEYITFVTGDEVYGHLLRLNAFKNVAERVRSMFRLLRTMHGLSQTCTESEVALFVTRLQLSMAYFLRDHQTIFLEQLKEMVNLYDTWLDRLVGLSEFEQQMLAYIVNEAGADYAYVMDNASLVKCSMKACRDGACDLQTNPFDSKFEEDLRKLRDLEREKKREYEKSQTEAKKAMSDRMEVFSHRLESAHDAREALKYTATFDKQGARLMTELGHVGDQFFDDKAMTLGESSAEGISRSKKTMTMVLRGVENLAEGVPLIGNPLSKLIGLGTQWAAAKLVEEDVTIAFIKRVTHMMQKINNLREIIKASTRQRNVFRSQETAEHFCSLEDLNNLEQTVALLFLDAAVRLNHDLEEQSPQWALGLENHLKEVGDNVDAQLQWIRAQMDTEFAAADHTRPFKYTPVCMGSINMHNGDEITKIMKATVQNVQKAIDEKPVNENGHKITREEVEREIEKAHSDTFQGWSKCQSDCTSGAACDDDGSFTRRCDRFGLEVYLQTRLFVHDAFTDRQHKDQYVEMTKGIVLGAYRAFCDNVHYVLIIQALEDIKNPPADRLPNEAFGSEIGHKIDWTNVIGQEIDIGDRACAKLGIKNGDRRKRFLGLRDDMLKTDFFVFFFFQMSEATQIMIRSFVTRTYAANVKSKRTIRSLVSIDTILDYVGITVAEAIREKLLNATSELPPLTGVETKWSHMSRANTAMFFAYFFTTIDRCVGGANSTLLNPRELKSYRSNDEKKLSREKLSCQSLINMKVQPDSLMKIQSYYRKDTLGSFDTLAKEWPQFKTGIETEKKERTKFLASLILEKLIEDNPGAGEAAKAEAAKAEAEAAAAADIVKPAEPDDPPESTHSHDLRSKAPTSKQYGEVTNMEDYVSIF